MDVIVDFEHPGISQDAIDALEGTDEDFVIEPTEDPAVLLGKGPNPFGNIPIPEDEISVTYTLEEAVEIAFSGDSLPDGRLLDAVVTDPDDRVLVSFTFTPSVGIQGGLIDWDEIDEAEVNGSSGADVISGFSILNPDIFITANGFGGADQIIGGRLGDELVGGRGNDEIRGLGGDDRLRGENGKDEIIGGGGDDFIYAGSGADVAKGGKGADFFAGGGGNDRLIGGAGGDNALGENGADVIILGNGDDTADGGGGRWTDLINLGGGNDVIEETEGRTIVELGAGRDTCRMFEDRAVFYVIKDWNPRQDTLECGYVAPGRPDNNATLIRVIDVDLANTRKKGLFIELGDSKIQIQNLAPSIYRKLERAEDRGQRALENEVLESYDITGSNFADVI